MFKYSGTKIIFAVLMLGFAQNIVIYATSDLTEGSGIANLLISENGSGGWSNNKSETGTTTLPLQEDTNLLLVETTVDAENVADEGIVSESESDQNNVNNTIPAIEKVENVTAPITTTAMPEKTQPTMILGTVLQSTTIATTVTTVTTTTPEPVTTTEPETTTTSTEAPPSFVCTTAGNFADSQNCTRYYECIRSVSASANAGDFQLQLHDCSPYTAYSQEHGRCLRDLSTCKNDDFDCISVGRFENPLSNNSYFWCVATLHGTFYKYQVPCSEGEFFYPVLRSCWYENWTNIPLLPTINVEANALAAIKMEMKLLKTEEKMKLKAEEQQEKLLKKQQKMLEKQAKKALKEQAKLAAKSLSAEES